MAFSKDLKVLKATNLVFKIIYSLDNDFKKIRESSNDE